MPQGDGTGPDGKGPKKVNKGFPEPKRDGSGKGQGKRKRKRKGKLGNILRNDNEK